MKHASDLLPHAQASGYRAASTTKFFPITDSAQWQFLLSHAALPHSVQSFAYGEAKHAYGWKPVRLLVQHGGRQVAIVQALEKRFLGFRVTRINRGPMFLEPNPDPRAVTAVYDALRQRYGRLPFGLLLIAPGLEDGEPSRQLLKTAGFHARKGNGWGSSRLDLTEGTDALFATFDRNWQKAIRSSVKANVTIEVADSEADHQWMIERHLTNMAEKGFSGHDGDFLRALRRNAGTDYVLFKAMHEGQAVAGLVLLRFGNHADSVVAWFGDEGRKVKAGNAITWGAICEMQKRGCTSYDVGGINSDKGFSAFKAGMNGDQYFLLGEYVSF